MGFMSSSNNNNGNNGNQTPTDMNVVVRGGGVGVGGGGGHLPSSRGHEDDDASLSVTSERASTIGPDSSTGRSTKESSKDANLEIARREERNVKWIRIATFAIVTLCAVGVCTLVFLFAKASDQSNFEIEYNLLVRDIQQLVVWEVKYNFALVEQLCGTITTEALMSEQTFPEVTMPHFEVTGGFVGRMGGIMMAAYAPLIPASLATRSSWETYSVDKADEWLAESAYLKVASPGHSDPLHGTIQDHEHDRRRLQLPTNTLGDEGEAAVTIESTSIANKLWKWEGDEKVVVNGTSGQQNLYAPLWQSSPHEASVVNADLLADPRISELFIAMIETDQTVMSRGFEIGNLFDWMFDPTEKPRKVEPHGFIMERVHADFGQGQEVVGIVLALTSFRNLFTRLIPESKSGIYVVIAGSEACGQDLTFRLDGPQAIFLGYDDLHEEGFEEYEASIPMELYNNTADSLCRHQLKIYPSAAYQQSYDTNRPLVFTVIVALAFFVTTLFFVIYERLVTQREKTKNAALRIVSSLFPSNVQDELLKGAHDKGNGIESGNLIASFYPATTVLFADIEGFTAWSSTREPAQVFHLLETIYGAFDEIARRRGIFKVETVGDCYVAVAGVPEAKKDHAVAMLRFARDCQARMAALSHQLEVTLGPDTADLGFRIGIHSGPVTGGVLRGQNSRFQLFGDTMNMAARMESTGLRGRIQMSTATAKLLIKAGKERWIEKRDELIDVKGKGSQETYFLRTLASLEASSSSGKARSTQGTTVDTHSSFDNVKADLYESTTQTIGSRETFSKKTARLIDWNTEVLSRRVKAIIAHRESHIDPDVTDIKLDTVVTKQLRQYVEKIATTYREENPFHNFDHASHVMLSIEKMLSRVNADEEFSSQGYTNDICSDPLAQFAVVLAALIHDADHYGVSNATLVKEMDPVAIRYHGKSPAENHSLCVGWENLLQPEYAELLKCITGNDGKEVDRLENLLTDAVLATDVFDPELKENRNARWAQVFQNASSDDVLLMGEATREINSMKAQIVLEHLIQASDVAHTMQHWHVYIKWNQRLFNEMTKAYYDGRMAKNPAEFWYDGEIGFLTHYIIPLANKLKDCNVFGVSCDEFLDYAQANLQEWKLKGRNIVSDFEERYKRAHFMQTKRSSLLNNDDVQKEEDKVLNIVTEALVVVNTD